MPSDTDLGTPERRRKTRHELEGDETPHVKFADATVLDWHLRRHNIDDIQHGSGLRFRRDFLIAGWMRQIIGGYAEWTDHGADGTYGPDVRMDAKDRVKEALLEVPMSCVPTIVTICGIDEHGGRGCVDRLVVGLDALTEHYERRRK